MDNLIRWEKENLEEIIKNSSTKTEVFEKLGLKKLAGNYNTLNRYLIKFKIDISHFKRPSLKGKTKSHKLELEQILVKDSSYANTSRLKKRLILEGILKEKCCICGQDNFWNNKKLVLIIDHINGINNDNRIENLRILCPNCNSQQDTFSGRNVVDKNKNKCIDCGCLLKAKRKSEKCYDCYSKKFYKNNALVA